MCRCVYDNDDNICKHNLKQRMILRRVLHDSTRPLRFDRPLCKSIGHWHLKGRFLEINSQSQFRIHPYAHISSCYEIKQLWLFGHISIYRNMTFVIPLLSCHSKRSNKPISKIWPYLLSYFVPNTCTWLAISWNYKFGRSNKIQGYDWMVQHSLMYFFWDLSGKIFGDR